jgi:hypothetical protein
MPKDQPMDEMMAAKDEYTDAAAGIQEETDAMLEVPKGKFSASALNGLVRAFNDAMSAADMEGNYPNFTSDQTAFPVEFVRGLAMISDAAAESGSGVEISLSGVVSDRDVALLASKVQALADDESFKSYMTGEGETEVEVTEEQGPEQLMMERA